MKPFLVKYNLRDTIINVDFIDKLCMRYWGHEVYPEINPVRGWWDSKYCEKIDTSNEKNS